MNITHPEQSQIIQTRRVSMNNPVVVIPVEIYSKMLGLVKAVYDKLGTEVS